MKQNLAHFGVLMKYLLLRLRMMNASSPVGRHRNPTNVRRKRKEAAPLREETHYLLVKKPNDDFNEVMER